MDEFLELLKSIFGNEFGDAEIEKAKALSPEAAGALKGALNVLNKYLEDMPDPLKEAVKVLGKYASYGYPAKKSADGDVEELSLEKVGARLSKATVEELKKIREIILKLAGEAKGLAKAREIVEALLSTGETVDKAKGGDVDPETAAKLKRLEELEAKEAAAIEKTAKEKEEAREARIKKLEADLEELKKTRTVKKSLDGQDDAATGGDDKPKWPSLGGSTE